MSESKADLFENRPIFEAVISLAIPTVISQIIMVIYNMADTFFIGLTGSDVMLSAVTVCMPAFMFLSAVSNLFGIGGSATISRALGRNDKSRTDNASAYALWGCVALTLAYSFVVFGFIEPFVNLLGGSHESVHFFAREYLMITVVFGGLFTSVSILIGHLLRSEGKSLTASIGIAIGGVTNIVLDPLFMFVILPKGNEALGAAYATMLANAVSLVYFLIVLWKDRKESVLTFKFNEDCMSDGSFREVIMTGLPACLMTLCENVSYAILDNLMAANGISYQAGLGVAKKVNMLAHCMVRGIAQGVLPLIAYNYSSKNYTRMKQTIYISSSLAVGVSLVVSLACILFGQHFIGFFIPYGGESLIHGTAFLKILCLGNPFSGFAYSIISFYQAVNMNWRSVKIAILRKGALDIPFMFFFDIFIPVYGIVWATPIADMICCFVAGFLFIRSLRELDGRSEESFQLIPSIRKVLS